MRRLPLEEGRRWLEQAEIDLDWSRHLYREGAYHLVCFLAQQVAEKALKGFLYAHGEEVVLGHSVARLCREAAQHEPSLQERCAHWAVLDTYYIPTRYPNGLPDDIPARVYDETTAQSALRLAEEVVTAIKTFFSEAE